MQNGRFTALSLIFLFLIATTSPLAAALVEVEKNHNDFNTTSLEEPILLYDQTELIGLESLELLVPKTGSTSGRAACVTQTDAGVPGDA